MASFGWMINLSGKTLPVYSTEDGYPFTNQIGKINDNECFVDGATSANPWEGDGSLVIFLNSSHKMVYGMVTDNNTKLVDFADYASNGTSWEAVNTLERKVQYATKAYDKYGVEIGDVPAGSRVWLTQNCTAGSTWNHYIAVTKVVTASGEELKISDHAFIDLTYGNRWVTVGSILLRKA